MSWLPTVGAVLVGVAFVLMVAYLMLCGLHELATDFRTKPRTSDYACSVCLQPIEGKVFELVKVYEELDRNGVSIGGSFTAAPYCKRHAPKGARRVR